MKYYGRLTAELYVFCVVAVVALSNAAAMVPRRIHCPEEYFLYYSRSGNHVSRQPCSSICPPNVSKDSAVQFCQRNCREYFRCLVKCCSSTRSSSSTDTDSKECEPTWMYHPAYENGTLVRCSHVCTSLDKFCHDNCPVYHSCKAKAADAVRGTADPTTSPPSSNFQPQTGRSTKPSTRGEVSTPTPPGTAIDARWTAGEDAARSASHYHTSPASVTIIFLAVSIIVLLAVIVVLLLFVCYRRRGWHFWKVQLQAPATGGGSAEQVEKAGHEQAAVEDPLLNTPPTDHQSSQHTETGSSGCSASLCTKLAGDAAGDGASPRETSTTGEQESSAEHETSVKQPVSAATPHNPVAPHSVTPSTVVSLKSDGELESLRNNSRSPTVS